MIVELSGASCAALVVAPIAGLVVVVSRMLGRSGRLDLVLRTLRRSKANLTVVALYDIAGAVLAVAAIVLLGITKPGVLVEYFHTDPVLAWAIFGALGPICAVGLIDRFPVERLVSLVDSQGSSREFQVTVARGAALRRRAVERILALHYEDLAVSEGSEHRSLMHRAKRLVRTDQLHFDDIALQVTKYVEYRQREMPPPVSKVLHSRNSWPTNHDAFEAALTLVGVALDQGLTRPISIACRIGESSFDAAEGIAAGT